VAGEYFKVPVSIDEYPPLGGEVYPLSDAQFTESLAEWTGNGPVKPSLIFTVGMKR
jgi:hypothetical protein